MRSSVLARIPGFRQRIIPEPHVPSRGSQARGTRLNLDMKVSPEFTRPSLSRRSMYCRDFDLCLSVCLPLRCRNSGGGTDGGSARKILNCVHIICKLFILDLQNIRTFPEETR